MYPVGRGVVHRYETSLILRVDVCAALQKELCHLDIVVAGGQMQRSGVPSLYE